ncbi:MAG: hypothetical protein QOF70_5726 [Acetobacteraceae bacterium]|jgi:hypothetical protein|nr:hypothetical protein [Acetobacteraceae bacterium]
MTLQRIGPYPLEENGGVPMRFVTPISPFPRHFKSANAGSWHPPLTRTQDYRPPGNFKTPRPAGPGASYGCQVEGSVASSTTDGAYDRDSVYGAVIDRDPKAAVIVPSRSTAGRARRLKPSPRNGTIVSGISPTKTGWGTAGSRPPSDVTGRSSVTGRAFVKPAIAPPGMPPPPTS